MRSLPKTPLALSLALATVLAPSGAHGLTAQHRLGHEAVPTFEDIRLNVDANQPNYTGSVRIALKVAAATDSFQLHSLDLKLARLALGSGRGSVPTTFTNDEHGILTVRTRSPLAPGSYTLEIDFSNDFNTRANSLYRLETGGAAYTFTQFEAEAAREAFPCWDEPEFKIPWQLTLTLPKSHIAISNTPVLKDTPLGAQHRVTFERTPPLPSYLLAMATGPLETVPIPGMSVPGRVITVKGSSRLTGEVVKAVPPILAALEKYFGTPYPYRKLDLLAVPEFWAGAMENAGAVTYREEILVLDPKMVTPQQRHRLISTTAHELAHMWFGDLVTLRWWDDIWLNESFASWMGDKISQQVAPAFNFPLEQVSGTHRAMATDARPSTEAVRQPVDGFANLNQVTGVLAYQKGQAILAMLEQWLSEEAFRRGVRDYLKQHAWATAQGADLWNSLSKAAGRDVAGPATSFLNQPGVPVVEVQPFGVNQVRLSQSRFLNLGDSAPGTPRWKIPVTLRYSDGVRNRTQTVLLADSAATVSLKTTGTLTWIYPNAEARGYYRWRVPAGMLKTLAEVAPQDLDGVERAGLVSNLSALLNAGLIHGDDELRLLARFANDPEAPVTALVLDVLEESRLAFVPKEQSGAFAVYVRRTLEPTLERIGVQSGAGEAPAVALLRPRLISWLGEYGEDRSILERARRLAEAYLKDPASIDPSLAQVALRLAALKGDASLFETYRQRFESAKLPVERDRLLNALGSFADPALAQKALAYALDGPLRPQEVATLFGATARTAYNQDLVFAWATRNYAKLASRFPATTLHVLVRTASGCSMERLAAARAFFTDPAHHPLGADQDLARTADQVHDCVSLREREGPAVAAYLADLAAAK